MKDEKHRESDAASPDGSGTDRAREKSSAFILPPSALPSDPLATPNQSRDATSSPIPHPSALLPGVTLFNSHAFWHAHEAWEVHWLVARGDAREFLQGLIQLAAAYYHVQRGTFSGGVRLFDAALRRLERFPAGYAGIHRDEVVEAAARHRERIARGEEIDTSEFPKLR